MIVRPEPRATFEPPRAGATRGAWNAWFTFLRRTGLRIPRVPIDLPAPRFSWRSVAVVLVPVYGWVALGKTSTARRAAIVYTVAALVAMVCLGLTAAGVAAGVMITIHGLGVAEYFYSGQLSPPPRHRILRYVMVVVLLGVGYGLATRHLLTAVVIPVQTGRGLVLINGWASSRSASADEIAAFNTEGWRAGHFRIPAGVYVGRTFARAGDVITFQPTTFAVNGKSRPRFPSMPKTGQLLVPPGRSFIWPLDLKLELANHEEAISFAENAALPRDRDVMGRGYSWWFWRRQSYEPVR